MRRPPTEHEDFRLDRLLLRKAQQGVKILIIVYKEVYAVSLFTPLGSVLELAGLRVSLSPGQHADFDSTSSTQTMSMSSAHTKHFLEDLHENIAVMRHPDHVSFPGGASHETGLTRD